MQNKETLSGFTMKKKIFSVLGFRRVPNGQSPNWGRKYPKVTQHGVLGDNKKKMMRQGIKLGIINKDEPAIS